MNEIPPLPKEGSGKKPRAIWYLVPLFLGLIGSAIMWFVLKDDAHPHTPKMIRNGWIIGIAGLVLLILRISFEF